MNILKILGFIALCFLINELIMPPLFAQDDASSPGEQVEEILSGFEDEEESSEIEEDALSGFDDEEESASDDDDLESGFDDESEEDEIVEEVDEGPSWWGTFSGSTGLSLTYTYEKEAPESDDEPDYRGLSRVRPFLRLEWKVDLPLQWKLLVSGSFFHDFFYSLQDRDRFTDEVLESNEQEAEFRDTYLSGSLTESLDLKLGRQIIVWGQADSLRVVDVLNPVDNRTPGLVDLEDLRLPVTMTRLDYYLGDWSLSAIAVHEIRFNKEPAFGSDFYPFDTELPSEEIPSHGGENTEYGLALKGSFSGWDASFYRADYFDDMAHLEQVKRFTFPTGQTIPTKIERRHSRLTMTGMDANLVFGNWILKMEIAYVQGLEFFALPEETKDRLDLLGAIEYSGIPDATLSIEMVNRHLQDYDKVLEESPDRAIEDSRRTSLLFRQDYLNQRLELVYLGLLFGKEGEEGKVHRVSLEYDVIDALSVKGGVLVFHPGETDLSQRISDNDRFFLESKYSF